MSRLSPFIRDNCEKIYDNGLCFIAKWGARARYIKIKLVMAPHSPHYRRCLTSMNSENNKQELTVWQLTQRVLAKIYQAVCYLIILDKKVFLLAVFSKFSMKALNSIAMILPIKIMLFLAPGQTVPDFLQSWFKSHGQFVLFLCFLTVLFLILSKLFEQIVEVTIRRKVRKIVTQNEGLSKKQKKQVREIVNKCIIAVSAALFVLCFMLILSWLYPALLLVFWACIAIIFIALHITNNRLVLNQVKENSAKFFNMIAELSFFIVFFYIVYEAMIIEAGHGFIVMILSLIIMRQCSSSLSQFFNSLADVYKQKNILLTR